MRRRGYLCERILGQKSDTPLNLQHSRAVDDAGIRAVRGLFLTIPTVGRFLPTGSGPRKGARAEQIGRRGLLRPVGT